MFLNEILIELSFYLSNQNIAVIYNTIIKKFHRKTNQSNFLHTAEPSSLTVPGTLAQQISFGICTSKQPSGLRTVRTVEKEHISAIKL